MFVVFLAVFLLKQIQSQLNFSAFTNLPNFTYTDWPISGVALYNNPKEIFVALDDGYEFPIVRYDVSTPTPVEIGRYIYDGYQDMAFTNIYFINNIMLASADDMNSPKFFDVTSYESLGEFYDWYNITSGVYIKSKNLFYMGINEGRLVYFNISEIPDPIVEQQVAVTVSVTIHVQVSASPDETYMSVTWQKNSTMLIYQLSNMRSCTLNVGSNPTFTHVWAPSKGELFIFPFTKAFFLNYKITVGATSNTMALVANKTGTLNTRRCFLYRETNCVICASSSTKNIFYQNWVNKTRVVLINNTWGSRGAISSDYRLITFYEINTNTVMFFQLLPFCKTGTFYNEPTVTCLACPANCSKCTSATVCTVCNENYLLSGATCVACAANLINTTSCSQRYACTNLYEFYSSFYMGCIKCAIECVNCLNSTYCSICSYNYQMKNGTCFECPSDKVYNETTYVCMNPEDICALGNYWDWDWWNCEPCMSDCYKCNSIDVCDICNQNFQVTDGSCEECWDGTFYNESSKTCDPCILDCAYCSDGFTCDQCNVNFTNINDSCVPCWIGTFYNSDNMTCDDCIPDCNSCIDGFTCLECAENFTIIDDSCIPCWEATWYNSQTLTCDNCTDYCILCYTGNTCDQCEYNYTLINDSCVECWIGTFYNESTMLCDSCLPDCDVCIDAFTCLQCAVNFTLINESCIPCWNATWYNPQTMTCDDCISDCVLCDSADTCLECAVNFTLINDTCVECWEATFYNEETMTCDNCLQNCVLCNSADTCLECAVDFTLINDTCVECWEATFYNEETLTCDDCMSDCVVCDAADTCLECAYNFTYLDDQCIPCWDATFYNEETMTCDDCVSDCVLCEQADICLECAENYQIGDDGSCYQCQQGTFYNSDTMTCDYCVDDCSLCYSSDVCAECYEDFVVSEDGQCVSCPEATVYNSSTLLCDNCPENCLSCQDSEICDSCYEPYGLTEDGQCVTCQDPQYYDVDYGTCETCMDNCLSCTSWDTCDICASNYTYTDWGSCEMCDVGMFYDAQYGSCDYCMDACDICTSATTCEKCYDYFFIKKVGDGHREKCVRCQNGWVYSPIIDDCSQYCAVQNCYACDTYYTCTVCDDGYLSSEDMLTCDKILCYDHCWQCYSNDECAICDDGYYVNDNYSCSVINCTKGCELCASKYYCYICSEGYLMTDDNLCVEIVATVIVEDVEKVPGEKLMAKLMTSSLQNNFVQQVNQIPASRILVEPVFSSFSNFDHLQFYNNHNRQYGDYASSFLGSINSMENSKWDTPFQASIQKKLGVNLTEISNNLNTKMTTSKTSRLLTTSGPTNSFFAVTLKYFCFYVPFVLLVFLVLQGLFSILRQNKISVYLRPFSFNLFIVSMLMTGNLEIFTYHLMFECKQMINLNHNDKWMNMLVLTLLMLLVFYLFAYFLITKISKKAHAKYFFGNYKISMQGLITLTLQVSLYCFLSGIIHMMFQDDYNTQVQLLLSLEGCYLLVGFCSLFSKEVYKVKYIEWINMTAAMIRIAMIISFAVDRGILPQNRSNFDHMQITIIVLCLANWLLAIFMNVGAILVRILIYYGQKIHDHWKVWSERRWRAKIKNNDDSAIMDPLNNVFLYRKEKGPLRMRDSVIKKDNTARLNRKFGNNNEPTNGVYDMDRILNKNKGLKREDTNGDFINRTEDMYDDESDLKGTKNDKQAAKSIFARIYTKAKIIDIDDQNIFSIDEGNKEPNQKNGDDFEERLQSIQGQASQIPAGKVENNADQIIDIED